MVKMNNELIRLLKLFTAIYLVTTWYRDKVASCMNKKLVVNIYQGYQINEWYRKKGLHQSLGILTKLPGTSEFKAVAHAFTRTKQIPRLIEVCSRGQGVYLSHANDKLVLSKFTKGAVINSRDILANVCDADPNIRDDIPGFSSFMESNTRLNNYGNIGKLVRSESQYVTNAQLFDIEDHVDNLSNLYHPPGLLRIVPRYHKFSLEHLAANERLKDQIILAHSEGPILRPTNIIEFYRELAYKLIEQNSKNTRLGWENCEHYSHAFDCILEGNVECIVCLNNCNYWVLDWAGYPIFNGELILKTSEIANILLNSLSKCHLKTQNLNILY